MHMCIIKLSACDVTWDIATTPDEGAGRGLERVGFNTVPRWLLLGIAVESPLSATGGRCLSSFAQMG